MGEGSPASFSLWWSLGYSCVSLCCLGPYVAFSSYKDTSCMGSGPTLMTSCSHLQRPYFQIRSHSQVLGGRTSLCPLWGQNSILNTTPGSPGSSHLTSSFSPSLSLPWKGLPRLLAVFFLSQSLASLTLWSRCYPLSPSWARKPHGLSFMVVRT
jgi:hypothetical protein